MSKHSINLERRSHFITRSIAIKLNLSTLVIGVLICGILSVYFVQETHERIKIQANIELSQITDTLKLALETNSQLSNMIRVVGVLATYENIDRLSVIKSSDMKINADSLAQHNGKLASKVFHPSIMALLLSPTKNHSQHSGDFIGHNLHHAVQFHLIDPEVNRLRPYIIYFKYDNTALEAGIKQSRDNYLLIVICGLALLLVINLWIQRVVILAPLSRITNQLKHQASNDSIPKPLNSTTKDEFNILINNYNHSIHKQLLQKKELEKSHRHIKNMTSVLPVHLAYVDTEEKIQFINRHSLNWLGYDINEVINHTCAEIIPANLYRIMQPYIKQTLNGEFLTFDVEFKHINQGYLQFHVTQVPDIDIDGKINGFFICIEDQTLTRNNEKKLEKYALDLEFNNWALDEAREVAEATARTKSEFLACMSHEIRTPMNGVLGMLALLSRTKLDQSQQHNLELAQGSAKSLLKLINDILDFSKIESGKLDIESIEFNLQQTLDELIQPLAIRAQEKDLELALDITQIQPVYIVGDPGRITQVLTNLIGNAIKFTQTGNINVIGQLSLMDNKHKLTFTIEDTGIGMREDKIEEVFQPFSQADSSTTRYYGGTGLGLSIARQLSQLMGGDISATSTEFTGSTFTFEIDIKLPSQTPIHQKISAPNLDKLPILLLSTTPLSDNILENILIGLNARVTKLNMPSGEDSFQHCGLDKLQPKIVILSLPTGKQAIEVVLSKLKDEPLLSQIPTLLNYSTIDAPVISHYIKQQIYAGFNKPIYQPELMTLLTNYSQDQLSISKDTVIESNDDWQLTKHFGSTQPRLLLAEDNMVNQLVAEGIINEFGLEIEIANNGIQALELLEKSTCDNPYHLIFMDCQMPKLDGYQTTQKIRAGEVGEIYKTIPIVAMTANAMVGDKEKCLNAGMNDYISKPLEPEHIRKALLASLAYLIDEDKRHHSG